MWQSRNFFSLCNEYSISNNITAMGGNATLLASISD